jgi:hypothetical protein
LKGEGRQAGSYYRSDVRSNLYGFPVAREELLLHHNKLAYSRLDDFPLYIGRFPVTKRGHSYSNHFAGIKAQKAMIIG